MESKILGAIAFLILFLSVYIGTHYYVFYRFSTLFSIKRTYWFYFILSCMIFLFPVMFYFQRFLSGAFPKMLYYISTIWLGALGFLFFSLLVYEVINKFTKVNSVYAGYVLLVVTFLLIIYSLFNALSLQVNQVDVPIPHLEKEMTVVQLSDIHLGTIHGKTYLQDIVDKTNALHPDIVLITGDLVDGGGAIDATTFAPLNTLEAPTYFTIGNHERYEGVDKVLHFLNTTKLKVLRNELVEEKGIQIIGVDNPEGFESDLSPLDSIEINTSRPAILMYHLPAEFEKAHDRGINLQLSGHTHNGQIFPFNLLIKWFFFPRVHGLYEYKGSYLYVSYGTGTWGPPLRLGSRSEITQIHLYPKK